jgi:hypothetical protein
MCQVANAPAYLSGCIDSQQMPTVPIDGETVSSIARKLVRRNGPIGEVNFSAQTLHFVEQVLVPRRIGVNVLKIRLQIGTGRGQEDQFSMTSWSRLSLIDDRFNREIGVSD